MIWDIEIINGDKHNCYLVRSASMQAAIEEAVRHEFPDDILKFKHMEAVLEIKVKEASQIMLLEE